MALTKTITKFFPTEASRKGTDVGIHLVITDDDRPDLGAGPQIVIKEDITEYVAFEGQLTAIIRDALLKKAQNLVDDYKKRKEKFKSTEYENGRTWIDNNLNL